MKNKNGRKIPYLTYAVLLVWTFVCVFPLYWMFTFSLKENSEIFGDNVLGLPKKWLFSNYADALKSGTLSTGKMKDSTILLGFQNSIIVTVLTITLTIICALMACYALTRMKWRGRDTVNNIFMLIKYNIHDKVQT